MKGVCTRGGGSGKSMATDNGEDSRGEEKKRRTLRAKVDNMLCEKRESAGVCCQVKWFLRGIGALVTKRGTGQVGQTKKQELQGEMIIQKILVLRNETWQRVAVSTTKKKKRLRTEGHIEKRGVHHRNAHALHRKELGSITASWARRGE